MKRKEINNINDFLNIGSRRIIYADYDNTIINAITLAEEIMERLLDSSFLIRWYTQGNYYTLAVTDNSQIIKCYITFFDDYISIDLSYDSLLYDHATLKVIYSLFTYYYYYG